MRFNTPKIVGATNLPFTPEQLNSCPNGLFRATFKEAIELMPELTELFDSAWRMLRREGHIPQDFEIDIKVHMLMPGQFPCIPNWHCDNVPRCPLTGATSYVRAEEAYVSGEPPMFLWVSGTPCTRFLARPIQKKGWTPDNHGELAAFIRKVEADTPDSQAVTCLIKPQTFYSMDRLTPHQGTAAQEHTWRVFMRLTHKDCLPDRPKTTVLRRHSQVYLDSANFGW